MLFIYLVAALMAAGLGYGSAYAFNLIIEGMSTTYYTPSGRGDEVLGLFLLLVIGLGSTVSVGFLLKAAYEELVYWDFPDTIVYHVRKTVWRLTQLLSSHYVVGVTWKGYLTEESLGGLGAYRTTFHYWFGIKKSIIRHY